MVLCSENSTMWESFFRHVGVQLCHKREAAISNLTCSFCKNEQSSRSEQSQKRMTEVMNYVHSLFVLTVLYFKIAYIPYMNIYTSKTIHLERAPSKSYSLMNVLMLRLVAPSTHRQTAC